MVVEPVIADVDSFLYKGKTDDYPVGDARRNFTFEASGLRNVLLTPTTAVGVKNFEDILENGVQKRHITIITHDPGLAQLAVEELGEYQSFAFYEGFDTHAIAWTFMYMTYGENITYSSPGGDHKSFDYEGNFAEILSPELKARYMAAADIATGASTKQPDDTIQIESFVPLSEFKAMITGEKNNEVLNRGRSVVYELAPAKVLTVFVANQRYVVTRDASGQITIQDVRTGETQNLSVNTKLVLNGIELTYRTSGIFTREGLLIKNTSGVDARVHGSDLPTSNTSNLQSSLLKALVAHINRVDVSRLQVVTNDLSSLENSTYYQYLMGNILFSNDAEKDQVPEAEVVDLKKEQERLAQEIFAAILKGVLETSQKYSFSSFLRLS
jgi:hypothetical protein